jgi:BirA family biotin operon repressor/biotin-[acetyl-CoA-carboxylase] ligase
VSESLPSDLADALAEAAPRLGNFADVRYFAELDSTNDTALLLAAQGAPEGTSVLADAQRAGRGRRGRAWFSPPGAGMYLSVIVRPESPKSPKSSGSSEPEVSPMALSLVTLAAGVAAAEAVTQVAGLPVELKWPNDVVIGRPWRKVGGLLCESAATGGRIDAVVIGIGINLRPAAYPAPIAHRATSIETELGRPIDRASLVVACLGRLRAATERLRGGRGDEVCREWRRFGRAGLESAPVRWHEHDAVRTGTAHDIAEDGALLVERDGRVERLTAGEVTWDRLSHDA